MFMFLLFFFHPYTYERAVSEKAEEKNRNKFSSLFSFTSVRACLIQISCIIEYSIIALQMLQLLDMKFSLPSEDSHKLVLSAPDLKI
ncbi:hypothetical protein TNCT_319491 [Trichonephila clavata]|uniref:Uncharacterized protein n=1 Tax=Trichonephila clavata TaxID=2740835 RepID=A0A8X6JC45_TRICU|nr:hypothetical protein TNCT_319491 [Trichonephila clavata]